jgi:hypothetical protein
MKEEEAKDLLSFLEMLLKIIYEFPANIRRKAAPTPKSAPIAEYCLSLVLRFFPARTRTDPRNHTEPHEQNQFRFVFVFVDRFTCEAAISKNTTPPIAGVQVFVHNKICIELLSLYVVTKNSYLAESDPRRTSGSGDQV